MIAYLSDFTGDPNSSAKILENIVSTAKKNNPRHGITGVLFYQKGRFLQVFEGNDADVKKLLNNIQRDKRHKNLIILFDEHVNSRGFEDWNMDSFDLDETEELDVDEILRIRDAIKSNIIPRADNLAELLDSFLKEKTFKIQQ